MVSLPDGGTVTEHSDGTRITTRPREVCEPCCNAESGRAELRLRYFWNILV